MPDVGLIHRPPGKSAEERAAGRAALPADLEPPRDERDGSGVDADDPALAALATLNDERPGAAGAYSPLRALRRGDARHERRSQKDPALLLRRS
jgi:hypothetical protein